MTVALALALAMSGSGCGGGADTGGNDGPTGLPSTGGAATGDAVTTPVEGPTSVDPTGDDAADSGDSGDSGDEADASETGEVGVVTVDGVAHEFRGACVDLREMAGRASWTGTAPGPNGGTMSLVVSYTYEPPSGAFAVVTSDDDSDGKHLNLDGVAQAASFEDDTIHVIAQVVGPMTDGTTVAGEVAVPCAGDG